MIWKFGRPVYVLLSGFFSFAVLLWILFAISFAICCQLHRMIFDELFVFEWGGGGVSFFHGFIKKFSLVICSQVVHTMFILFG